LLQYVAVAILHYDENICPLRVYQPGNVKFGFKNLKNIVVVLTVCSEDVEVKLKFVDKLATEFEDKV
ncbi:10676_t:CDS:2, partial [Racocetra persica]